MTGLPSLPPELLLNIAKHLENESSELLAFAKVNTLCYNVILPLLYSRYGHLAVGWAVVHGSVHHIKFAVESQRDPAERHALLDGPVEYRRFVKAGRIPTDPIRKFNEASDSEDVSWGRFPGCRPRGARFCGREGAEPVILASLFGHTEVVSYLINLGVSLSCSRRGLCRCEHPSEWLSMRSRRNPLEPPKRHLSWTPLHYALCGRHASTASLLLDHGAPLQACTERSRSKISVLHIAASRGMVDFLRRIRDIYQKSGDKSAASAKDEVGRTAMHYVAWCPDFNTALDTIQILLNWGLNVDESDHHDYTPFLLATQIGSFAAARAFLRCSTDRSKLQRVLPWKCKDGDSRSTTALYNVLEVPYGVTYGRVHGNSGGMPMDEWKQNRLDLLKDLLDLGVFTQLEQSPEREQLLILTARKGLVKELDLLMSYPDRDANAGYKKKKGQKAEVARDDLVENAELLITPTLGSNGKDVFARC